MITPRANPARVDIRGSGQRAATFWSSLPCRKPPPPTALDLTLSRPCGTSAPTATGSCSSRSGLKAEQRAEELRRNLADAAEPVFSCRETEPHRLRQGIRPRVAVDGPDPYAERDLGSLAISRKGNQSMAQQIEILRTDGAARAAPESPEGALQSAPDSPKRAGQGAGLDPPVRKPTGKARQPDWKQKAVLLRVQPRSRRSAPAQESRRHRRFRPDAGASGSNGWTSRHDAMP